MTIKLVFLDADDLFLTPPYEAMRKLFKLRGITNFPSPEAFLERSHIDFDKAFPELFPTKASMWASALASIPLGFFSSQDLHKELDLNSLRSLLADKRVYVLSKNPPSFAPMRRARIKALTGVALNDRYIACGPIVGKGERKADVITRMAKAKGVALNECLLVDDSIENCREAASAGIRTLLIDAAWNRGQEFGQNATRISRASFPKLVSNMLQTRWIHVFPFKTEDSISMGRRLVSSGAAADVLFLEHNQFLKASQKGPHNDSIDGFARALHGNVAMVLHLGNSDVKLLVSSELERFKPEYPEQNILMATKLRAFCRSEFESAGCAFDKPAFFNFYYRSRKAIVNELLANDSVADAVALHAETHNVALEECVSLRDRHVIEMISNRTYRGAYLSYLFLSLLNKVIFRKVIHSAVLLTDDHNSNAFTIFASNHRSYLDSYLLYLAIVENSPAVPHIIAADKMRKVWVGKLGALVGAVFIKRKIGDAIYQAILKEHLRQIYNDGGSLEIFIEGQRSRSGMQLHAKKGIIALVETIAKKFTTRPTSIIPVAFAYNQLPESEFLLKEVVKERLGRHESSLREEADFKAWQKMTKLQLARACISYLRKGEYIDCAISMDQAVQLGGGCLKVQLRAVTESIKAITPVHISSLVCRALLEADQNHAERYQIEASVESMRRVLVEKGVEVLGVNAIEEALLLPFINRKFKNAGLDERDILCLDGLDVVRATHYANNVQHFFLDVEKEATCVVV